MPIDAVRCKIGDVAMTLIDSHGNRTDYRYDPVGRLAGIWAANGEGIAFSYDDAGRLMEKWFPNRVNTQYSYNQDNTLKQLVNRHGSGSIMSQHEYSYDPFGNRATHTEIITGLGTKPFSYTYDELNRLKERSETTVRWSKAMATTFSTTELAKPSMGLRIPTLTTYRIG